MRNFVKLGNIFSVCGKNWMYSHAQNPLPEDMGGGIYKIHFSSRDHSNRAHGGYFILDIENPSKIIEVSKNPTIRPGNLGAFDDCGVMPSSIIKNNNETKLYYTGWSKAVTVPFSFHIGLATSPISSPVNFERVSHAPILGRNYYDPYITGAPYVIFENNCYTMWYISATKWEKDKDNTIKHFYTIKKAISDDGLEWKCSDELCIPYGKDEYAIARPVVLKEKDTYEMWFTFRGGKNSYRIGYAESTDGLKWIRKDHIVELDVSESGWDSQMICYPHPIYYKSNKYLLYNGNEYGKTGIGLAIEV